ncbi:hypothetical protein [Microcoleus sp. F4-D5]
MVKENFTFVGSRGLAVNPALNIQFSSTAYPINLLSGAKGAAND